MKQITIEDLRANPDLIDKAIAQARREQALAVRRLLFEPLKRLLERRPAQINPAQHRPRGACG